jgi:hypothetical protein
MNVDPRDRSEIDRLLETLRDGQLDDAEAEYLESLLSGSREIRRYYIQAVALQVGLRRLSAASEGAVSEGLEPEPADPIAPASSLDRNLPACVAAPTSEPPGPVALTGPVAAMPLKQRAAGGAAWNWISTRGLLVSAVAGLLAVGSEVAWFARPASKPEQKVELATHDAETDGSGGQDDDELGPAPQKPSTAVAQVARTSHCRWAMETGAPEMGDDLEAGRMLVLDSGLAEIIFQGGAHTLLQGPATLEIRSPSSAFLHCGKFTVTVEDPSARGFVVRTPEMKYTDLGTEFGVIVAPGGEEEVHVFRGEVVAEKGPPPGVRASAVKKVAAGTGATGIGATGIGADARQEAQPPAAPPPLHLLSQQAIRVASAARPIERIASDEELFVRTRQLTEVIAEQSPQLRRWTEFREQIRARPDLFAYYDCQYDVADRGVVHNCAASGDRLEGRMAGPVRWCEGRLPGKQGLRFNDRGGGVRIEIPDMLKQISIIVSIRVDHLSGSGYQMILGSDSWRQRSHALHWQLSDSRGSGFGVSNRPECFGVYGPPHESQEYVGRWTTMAVTCDSATLEERTYLDGALRLAAQRPVTTVQIGPAMIGTFRHEDPDIDHPERTLRGAIDELMIFNRALSGEEIARICNEMAAEAGS